MLKSVFATLFLVVAVSFTGYSQDSTTVALGSDYFLQFVKKVYLNPTILLKTQDFREEHNVRVMILPDMNGQTENTITGFERALQKIIRFLIEGDDEGTIRLYFDSNDPNSPFTLVHSEELHCKFVGHDKDSILARLNAPFAGVNYTIESTSLFETALEDGLEYIGNCLRVVPSACGDQPDYATTEINTKPLSIALFNTTGSKYDLDRKQYDLLESHYAKAYDLHTESDWYAPAKFMAANGSSDEPIAIAIDKHEALFKKQNISFRTVYNDQVIPIEPSSTNDTIKLKLPKDLPPGNPIEVVVKYESPVDSITYTVGFFMVYVFEPQTIKLNLIAVNGYNLDASRQAEIAAGLKKVYDPVGVTFDISVKTLLPDSDWPTSIEIESSGLLSNYPPDLRDYVGGVKDLPDYESDEYYLVYGLTTAEIDGYMPRARNIGFIFAQSAPSTPMAPVTAHELGHGVFHLRHIFAEEELGLSVYRQTANVMDYVSNPLELYLHQWKAIDDPGFVSWNAGDDEDGAGSVGHNLQDGKIDKELLNNDKKSVSFITPGGEIISFEAAKLTEFYFKYVSEYFGQYSVPIGVLTSFVYDGKRYEADLTYFPATMDVIQNEDTQFGFSGYKSDGVAYVDSYRETLPDSVKLTACFLVLEGYSIQFWRSEMPTLMDYGSRYAAGQMEVFRGGMSFPVLPFQTIQKDNQHYKSYTNIRNLSNEQRLRYTHLRNTLANHRLSESKKYLYGAHIQVLDICSLEPEILYLFSAKDKLFRWDEEGVFEYGMEALLEATTGIGLNSGFDELMENNEYNSEFGGKPLDMFKTDRPQFYRKVFIPRYHYFKSNIEIAIRAFWDDFSVAKFEQFSSDEHKEAYINMLRIALNVTPTHTLELQPPQKKQDAIRILTSTDNWFTAEWEDALVKLLKGVTAQDAGVFLNTVQNETNFSLDGNDLVNLTDFISSSVHNVGIGEQYTEMVIHLTRIALSDENRISELNTRIMTDMNPDKYIVPYYHTGFWTEVKTAFNPWAEPTFETYSEIEVVGGIAKVKFSSYKYEMQGGALFPVVGAIQNSFEVIQAERSIEAFDLIMIQSKTEDITFVDLSPETAGKVNGVYPAFVLNYMDDEATTKKIMDGVEALVDLATIAAGLGPAMAGLRTLRGLVALVDVTSGALNIANNMTGGENQTLSFFNDVFSVASIGFSVHDIYQGFKTKKSINALVDQIPLAEPVKMRTLVDKLRLDVNGQPIVNGIGESAIKTLMHSSDINNKVSAYAILKKYEDDLRRSGITSGNDWDALQALKNEVDGDWINLFRVGSSGPNWSAIHPDYRDAANSLMSLGGKMEGFNIKLGNKVIASFDETTNVLNIPLTTGAVPDAAAVKFFPEMTFYNNGFPYPKQPMMVVKNTAGEYFCLIEGACFTAGTPVKTDKGFVPIEKIGEGDEVMSFNENTQTFEHSKVTSVFRKATDKLVRLVVGRDTLYATTDHLFYSAAKEWVPARMLNKGAALFLATGIATVTSSQIIDSVADVYNFEVANTHTYVVGYDQAVVHNDCNWYKTIKGISHDAIQKLQQLKLSDNALFEIIKRDLGTNGADIEKFLQHFPPGSAARAEFVAGTILISDWRMLGRFHTDLCKDAASLLAFSKARKNNTLKLLGFTDELLAKVNGYTNASYAQMMNDLDDFAKNIAQQNITIENFQATIGILTGNNMNYRQGVHWIIQDLKVNAASFNGKTLQFEFSVANARSTISSIDVFCGNCVPPNLKIEYKSGPGSITSSTIKEQFIERDLFNAATLSEIQWRMTNTEFTPDKLKLWMKANKTSIDALDNGKKALFFPGIDVLNGVSDSQIDTFVDNNYTTIFR